MRILVERTSCTNASACCRRRNSIPSHPRHGSPRYGQTKEAFLENRIAAVPECQREAAASVCRSEIPRDAVFAPAIRRATGLVMTEGVPGVAVLAQVFANRSPLSFAQIGAPPLPTDSECGGPLRVFDVRRSCLTSWDRGRIAEVGLPLHRSSHKVFAKILDFLVPSHFAFAVRAFTPLSRSPLKRAAVGRSGELVQQRVPATMLVRRRAVVRRALGTRVAKQGDVGHVYEMAEGNCTHWTNGGRFVRREPPAGGRNRARCCGSARSPTADLAACSKSRSSRPRHDQ